MIILFHPRSTKPKNRRLPLLRALADHRLFLLVRTC